MNIQTIKHNFKLGKMNLKEIEWLIDTVEQQQIEYAGLLGSVTETDTIIKSLQEESQELHRKICQLRAKTSFRVYEENLRLAQELALLKVELSG